MHLYIKKENANICVKRNDFFVLEKLLVMVCLVDCNRRCNVILFIWFSYSLVWLCFYYKE